MSRLLQKVRWRKNTLAGEGSNLQHPAPKADVLPIELPAKGFKASPGPNQLGIEQAPTAILPHDKRPSLEALTRQTDEPSLHRDEAGTEQHTTWDR